MSMSSVHILAVDQVLPRRPFPPPGDVIPLSFFDAYWVSFPPVQRLLLFPATDADLSFSTLLHSLKSSLSEALHLFHPLSGKLTYLPTSNLIIDCSAPAVADGVNFTIAESDIDIGSLSADPTHMLSSYIQLVPELDVKELPAAVFAVQVTRFVGGGVSVGYSVHHTVVDGKGVWRFLETWAAACKAEMKGTEKVVVEAPPCHDRAVIGYEKGDEVSRRYLLAMAPELPRITGATSSLAKTRLNLTRKTFTLSPTTIKTLKRSTTPSPPSTFIALAAHAWISYAHAKSIPYTEPTTLVFVADCRTRLNPPIPDSFTGNCVRAMYLNATGADLLSPGGFEWACMKIKIGISEFMEEPLRRCEEWADEYLLREKTRDMYVVGSPWFRGYEMDFGFGKPGRVELVSMNHDGEVVLLGGKEEGEVQVSVALSADNMDEFAEAFGSVVTPV